MHLTGDHVRLTPSLPPGWDRATVRLRHGASEYVFELCHSALVEPLTAELDDQVLSPADLVPLRDDGATHTVRVRVPRIQSTGRFS